MSIVNIRAEIKALVDAVQTALSQIAVTYNYEPTETIQTPAVAVILDQSSEDDDGNTQNTLNANFICRVMVEKNTDDSTQTTLLLTIVDTLLASFRLDSNRTLNGDSYDFMVSRISPVLAATKGNTNVLYVDIGLEAKAFVSVL